VDTVLGLSVTPSAVGLVLVEGQDADGSTVDREAFEIVSGRHATPSQASEQAAAAVLRTEAIAASRGQRLHSIGVTWSDGADNEASLLLKSLSDCGFDNVVPVRLPEATEALAWGIAEVIGHQVTAVCVIEPETVIMLIVHAGVGAVQTAVNHAIDTEEALLRWLSAVFTKADWRPEALVVVGSGGDLHSVVPRLEDILSVPVFVPAESELALARGAALASAHHTEFIHVGQTSEPAVPRERRRLTQTGPLAMLVVGAVTFVGSVSVAVSLQMAPERHVASSEAQPAAKASPDIAAAAARAAIPQAPVPAPVEDLPLPPPEAPPIEVAPPAGTVDIAVAPPVDGLPAAVPGEAPLPEAPMLPASDAPIEALPPAAAPPAPGLVPAQPTPVPEQRPGLLSRIRDRLSNIGRNDDVPGAQQAAVPGAPAAPAAPPIPAAPPSPEAAVPAPEAPPLLPPQ
jgi:hypothetical protein